jgi:hypothetical protein
MQDLKRPAGAGLGGGTEPEPVLVVPDGEHHILQTCTRCSATQRAELEPASRLLDAMQAFVCAHADCPRSRPVTEILLP